MAKIKGDCDIRIGSTDPKTWQLLNADGTPFSLEGATKVTFRRQDEATGTTTDIDTVNHPTKLEFLSPASAGKIRFTPASNEFSNPALFRFFFIVDDADGSHPIPEGRDYTLRVLDNYPPPPP
jgi:hypothetical protein